MTSILTFILFVMIIFAPTYALFPVEDDEFLARVPLWKALVIKFVVRPTYCNFIPFWKVKFIMNKNEETA